MKNYKSKSYEEVIRDFEIFKSNLDNLVTEGILREEGIRLLGVGVSNFTATEKPQDPQMKIDF